MTFRDHLREGRRNGYPLCCILRFAWDMTHGNIMANRLRTDRGGYVGCGVFHRSKRVARRFCLRHRWSSRKPLVITGEKGAGHLRYCDRCETAQWVQQGPLPKHEWGFLMHDVTGGDWPHRAPDFFVPRVKP